MTSKTNTTECKHDWFDYGIGEICLKCNQIRNLKFIMSPKQILEKLG